MDTTSHRFKPSQLNISLCAVCYLTEDRHGSLVTCESCSNEAKLTNVNDIWLCPECLSAELETPKSIQINEITKPEIDEKFVQSAVSYMGNEINKPIMIPGETIPRDTAEIEHTALNTLGSQAIQKDTDFFNARIKPINDRWQEIQADSSIPNLEEKHYQLAKEIREHFIHLKGVLFTHVQSQLECIAEMRADQVYLNSLAGKLREEYRVKLHLANIDYVPPTPKKAATVKVSKDDKIAAGYAQLMGIDLATAKRLINNKLREVVGECTCSETPGICKIHT